MLLTSQQNWLVNKMYFNRISVSAITSHGFDIIFNFIITTAVAYVLRWEIPSLLAPLLDKRTPSLPNDKHCTEGFGLWNLVWSCNSPFSFNALCNITFALKTFFVCFKNTEMGSILKLSIFIFDTVWSCALCRFNILHLRAWLLIIALGKHCVIISLEIAVLTMHS